MRFEAVNLTDYTKLIEKIAKQLHEGTLKPSDLNTDLLTTILGDVRTGFADGYGKEFSNYAESPAKKLSLNQNLYRFSAAKTYQELAKINLARQNNPNFADFKKEALKVNKEYNIQYLQTEFNTANRQGVMAQKWTKIQEQKSLYPNLTYKTVKDNRVREEHKNLQDITKPVDDPFWDKWYPPNGWACRCYVVQTDTEPTPGTPEGNPTPGFHGNVGKNDMVFNENEHPYFVFPAEDVKKIKASFEDLKISTPDYQTVFETKKAKLEVSTWADPNDLEANLKSAKIIVDKLGVNVKIRNHTEVDGIKNPEYDIYGLKSDLKVIDKIGGIKNGIENMYKKMKLNKNHFSVVFNLDNVDIKLKEITDQLQSKFNVNRGTRIDQVFFIKNGKAVELTRDNILKKEFSKLKGIL